MLVLQAVYEKSGKRYTFQLKELAKGILTDEQLKQLQRAVLKEISKL